jgi:hypothetical protein
MVTLSDTHIRVYTHHYFVNPHASCKVFHELSVAATVACGECKSCVVEPTVTPPTDLSSLYWIRSQYFVYNPFQ